MSQIRLKVSELQNTINAAQSELFKLQTECQHPSYHAAMYMWRVGAFFPTRICNDCSASIPGITDEEAKVVNEQWGRSVGTTTIIQGDENSPSVSIFTTTSSGS